MHHGEFLGPLDLSYYYIMQSIKNILKTVSQFCYFYQKLLKEKGSNIIVLLQYYNSQITNFSTFLFVNGNRHIFFKFPDILSFYLGIFVRINATVSQEGFEFC